MTGQQQLFLYGTLCDLELLEIVSGARLSPKPASLSDHAVYWAKEQSFPIILRQPGQVAEGILISVDAAAKARLDFYELGFGYRLVPCEVDLDGSVEAAEVYYPEPDRWPMGERWSLADWQARFGPLSREAAKDYIRLSDRKAPADAAPLFQQIRSRAASRLRARQTPTPSPFVAGKTNENVAVSTSKSPVIDFFEVVQETLEFQRFDGSSSGSVQRMSLIGGDAVTVLPYDPATDNVLVIRQFRHGAFARGDLNPWCLEPPAGRIDPFETPDVAARRELLEETGVQARALHKVASYYPTPAAYSEHLTSYIALADLSGQDGVVSGVPGEAEDIMSHVMPLSALLDMIETGAANTGPLVLSALWLQANRGKLQ